MRLCIPLLLPFACVSLLCLCSYCCGLCVSKLPQLLRYTEHVQPIPAVQVAAAPAVNPAPDAGDAVACQLPCVCVTLPEKCYMPQPHVEVWMKQNFWQVTQQPRHV